MKLSHLFEAVDHRDLLREVAKELGFQNPQFYDIDDETTNAAEVEAGIDLFRLHLDTEGSAEVRSRLQAIERLVLTTETDHDGIEALDYFDGSTFDQLPHVKAYRQALVALKATHMRVRSSAITAQKAYALLSAINTAAIETFSSKHTADEVKYRASIARACLKQLGIAPKDL